MKALALINGASYGAEALPTISKAYDAAWAEIAGIFDKDPLVIEKARELLARAGLSIASEDGRSVDGLKKAALERMASDYRRIVRY